MITLTTHPSNDAFKKHQKEASLKRAFYLQKEIYNRISKVIKFSLETERKC